MDLETILSQVPIVVANMAIFLVVYFIFSRVFFGPYLALLEARDEAAGVDRSADDHGHDAASSDVPEGWVAEEENPELVALRERVHTLTADLNHDTVALREEITSEARGSASETLEEAGADAAQAVVDAQKRAEEVRNEIWAGLAAQKGEFLSAIEQKVLG